MRKKILFFAIISFAVNAFSTVVSEKTNGLSVAFCAAFSARPNDNEPMLDSEILVWRPYYDDGIIELNYPDREYGIRVKMVGADGKEVRKTALGKAWGSKFDKLYSYQDSRRGCIDAAGPFNASDAANGLSGPLLVSPNELFIMEKPGIYILEIQMQMFKHTGSPDPEIDHRNLFRFPPVKIKVKKSEK